MTIVLQSKRYRGAKFRAGLDLASTVLVLYGDEQG
jgi:hypothetical protein